MLEWPISSFGFFQNILWKNPKEFFEPALILLIVILNATMGVIQENKAEKAMEAAEAKLDEYALAMEDGMGVQLQMTSAKTKKGK